ncbi:MAG: hypothetical protein MI922_19590 [Bacteroidales bacterium]|nr:hypothetical protein [Bacteroidales bacterium]
MKPIRFNKELDSREELAIQKLKDIRTIQVAYKSKYGQYTGSFDTLLSYVKTDSFEIVSEKIVTDWNQDEVTKEDAIKQGIIKVTKSYIPVTDSLTNNLLYDIDDIRYVPFTNRETEIALAAGEIETASKVVVKVFEASVKYLDLLNGMDEQLVVNHIDNKYVKTNFEGLKVGSMVEATNNAGNWED